MNKLTLIVAGILAAIALVTCIGLFRQASNDELHLKLKPIPVDTVVVQPQTEYNTKVDSMVNTWLSNNVSVTKQVRNSRVIYTVAHDTIRIVAVHELQVEYEQVEDWCYYFNFKNGGYLLMDKDMISPDHKLSSQTYERINKMCLSIK